MSKEGQHSPSVGSGSKVAPSQWFTNEIQQMMYGLGDCRRPHHDSASLVEEIVQQQMIILLHKASEVAALRGGRFIGLEDLLFLMRKDKVKLRRLLKYLELKDLKSSTLRSLEDDETAESVESKVQPIKRRRKICYDFLSSIDQTGELLEMFDNSHEAIDEVKQERLLRAELQSRCLDPQKYLEFCEARQVNFSRRYKSQRFKDWLLAGAGVELKPNAYALELISYLAYETVAQIVDLALLVKKDSSLEQIDPVYKHMPGMTHTFNENVTTTVLMGQNKTTFPVLTSPTQVQSPPGTPVNQGPSGTPGSITLNSSGGSTKSKSSKKRKKNGHPVSMETPVSQAILPTDIKEVIRRYTGMYGPFASLTKGPMQFSPKTTLLCN